MSDGQLRCPAVGGCAPSEKPGVTASKGRKSWCRAYTKKSGGRSAGGSGGGAVRRSSAWSGVLPLAPARRPATLALRHAAARPPGALFPPRPVRARAVGGGPPVRSPGSAGGLRLSAALRSAPFLRPPVSHPPPQKTSLPPPLFFVEISTAVRGLQKNKTPRLRRGAGGRGVSSGRRPPGGGFLNLLPFAISALASPESPGGRPKTGPWRHLCRWPSRAPRPPARKPRSAAGPLLFPNEPGRWTRASPLPSPPGRPAPGSVRYNGRQ